MPFLVWARVPTTKTIGTVTIFRSAKCFATGYQTRKVNKQRPTGASVPAAEAAWHAAGKNTPASAESASIRTTNLSQSGRAQGVPVTPQRHDTTHHTPKNLVSVGGPRSEREPLQGDTVWPNIPEKAAYRHRLTQRPAQEEVTSTKAPSRQDD